MAFRVNHRFLLTFSRGCMHSESSLRIDDVPTDRTEAFLPPPNGQQLFPALCAVQHFLTLAFLEIIRPPFIKRIGFRNDFLETDNFRVRCIFEFDKGFCAVSHLDRGSESPLPVIEMPPVFRGNPLMTFLFVSAFGPLPQAFVNLVIHPAENF